MGRTPKTDPNIYQVDLVAGLFGAFMLVWISGAQETEFPGDQVDPLTFAVVEMTATVDDGGAKSTYSIVQAEAVDAACLSQDYLVSANLANLSDIACPKVPDRRKVNRLNVADLAYVEMESCRSSKSTTAKPWPYSYSLVTGSLARPGLGLRGIFESSQPTNGGVLPHFETSYFDPSIGLVDFIAKTNAELNAKGRDTLTCDPEAAPRQIKSLFVVDEDLLDIWNSSSVDLTADLGHCDGLMVFGEIDAKPTIWTIPCESPNDPSIKLIPTKWDQAKLNVRLCAYRDGSKRCFAAKDQSIASPTLVLAWRPDA